MSSAESEHEIELAEREAVMALGEGWEFELPDSERFRLPGAVLDTYTVAAHRQGQELAMVVAIGKANAFRQLVRRVRGDLPAAEAWAPPLPPLDPNDKKREFLGPYGGDSEIADALAEARSALPEGWTLYDVDRERLRIAGRKLDAFGVSAVAPGGEGAFVLAVGEASAYRNLARRVRGELEVSDSWAPRLDFAN